MSRDDRDKRGGHNTKHGWRGGSKFPAEVMRAGRRAARRIAKHALRKGEEPEPRYPIERYYLD